jgi:hypothetical protein
MEVPYEGRVRHLNKCANEEQPQNNLILTTIPENNWN